MRGLGLEIPQEFELPPRAPRGLEDWGAVGQLMVNTLLCP